METRLPIAQIQPHRYRTTIHHRLAALAFDNLHHGQSPFLQSPFVLTRKGYCVEVGLLIPSPKCCARKVAHILFARCSGRPIAQGARMTVIVLFGGRSDERHVSVASAQNVVRTLGAPLAWFWAPNGAVYDVNRDELFAHLNPFT